ncbi:MAG: thioredoxin domain-containing protein [Novosphingobium sp.]|nr:thioredoxin domain-containing protein [Novosphingobium sp.]
MNKTLISALSGAALLGTAIVAAPLIAKPAAKGQSAASRVQWDAKLTRSASGNHLVGNPAAKTQLVEFISYTCGHCAHYAVDSKAPLFTGPVRLGKVSIEIRPFFRNGIDVAATLLAQCGPDSRFLGNHHAILASQGSWMKKPSNPKADERWATPDFGLKMKYVAEDMGLYKLMLGRGYTPAQLDRCLADKALGDRLANQTKDASERIGVQGTPSFLINGKLQAVYDWPALKPLLANATR